MFTLISSCAISNLNTVSAPPWDYWKKSGYSKEMTQMFLYENCRYLVRPKLEDYPNKSEFEAEYRQRVIAIDNCMLSSGFIFSLDGTATPGTVIWSSRCDKAPLNGYPSCQSLKKGQEPILQSSPPAAQDTPATIYVPPTEYPEKSIQLQQDMQKDNNRQMKDLLRNTVPKTR